MNTTSLILNGRTAASIALLPERQPSSLTTVSSRPNRRAGTASPPSSLFSILSGTNPPSRRSPAKRASNRDSPGWYNTEGGMTLDDFARRLNTRISKFEQWQGKCAQSVVMALMRPTPVSLFIFNPVSLLLWLLILTWWIYTR